MNGDFVKIPVRLLQMPAELLQLYCAVRSFDWQKKEGDRVGCTASVQTLAKLMRVGTRQIHEKLRRLEALGAIRIIPTTNGGSLRVLCTPEGFDPNKLPATPAANRRPPLRPTADPPPAANRRQSRSRDQVETVETISRDPLQRSPNAAPPVQKQNPPLQVSLIGEDPPAKRKRRAETKEPPPSSAVWDAYADAYARRWGAAPPRSAKANKLIQSFMSQVPAEEAAAIAAYYVASPDAYYTTKMHPLNLLTRDAPKLRTEWFTKQRVNAETARREEKTQANPFWDLALEAERREERERNASSK